MASKKPGGSPSANATRAGGSDLRTTIKARTISEYEPAAVGAILYGMIRELEAPQHIDTTDVLPPGSVPGLYGAQDDGNDHAEWSRWTEERAIGRELARQLGKVLVALRKTPADGQRHYQEALRRAQANGGGGASGSLGGLLPPLAVPTAVTSRFAEARRGAAGDASSHRGVDLRAAPGTPLVAPAGAKVLDVWEEQEGGLSVRIGLQRPDGGYAGETTTADDSGLLVTYAHLSQALARAGDVVTAGQSVALSGSSGQSSTGPHAHVAVEYFNDAPAWSLDTSNSRVFLDPEDVWGGADALTGNGAPALHQPGDVLDGLAVPRNAGGGNPMGDVLGAFGLGGGGGGGGVQPLAVTVNNNGALVVGGGTAVNTPIRVTFPLAFGGGSGEGGYGGNVPVPDALRGVAQQYQNAGWRILEKGGNLLASFITPDNVARVVQLGGTLAGAAGSLAGVLGPLATAVAPLTGAIPYVGPAIAAVLGIGGPIASVAGPVVAGLGGAAGMLPGLTNMVGNLTGPFQQAVGNALNLFPSGNPAVQQPSLGGLVPASRA